MFHSSTSFVITYSHPLLSTILLTWGIHHVPDLPLVLLPFNFISNHVFGNVCKSSFQRFETISIYFLHLEPSPNVCLSNSIWWLSHCWCQEFHLHVHVCAIYNSFFQACIEYFNFTFSLYVFIP